MNLSAFAILIGLTAIGGCNAAPKEIVTADGRQGHILDCSPKMQNAGRALQAMGTPEFQQMAANTPPPQPNWGICFEQAGKLCGSRGYDVMDRQPSGSMVIQCRQ